MSDLADLKRRVEEATGPDRELDAAIAVALDSYFIIPPRWEGDEIGYGYVDRDGVQNHPAYGGAQLVPVYTASLDATVALIEQVMPGYSKQVIIVSDHAVAEIWKDGTHRSGIGKIGPLALLAALLSACEGGVK